MPDLCSQDPTFSKVIHFMDGCTALYKGHASSVDGSFAAANRDFISFEADKEKEPMMWPSATLLMNKLFGYGVLRDCPKGAGSNVKLIPGTWPLLI